MGLGMSDELKDRLLALFLASERQAATNLVTEWAELHGYKRAITDILEPALATLGETWATTDDVSLGQGYVAGKVAEDLMERAAAHDVSATEAGSKGPVVIGNIEDDSHALGRRLVTIFLRLAEWDVVDLGKDVPASVFVDKAVAIGAPIVAASAMMYRTAVNIKQLREEINARNLTGRIQLAVGGAVFLQRPELVDEVGGDGTAPNAIVAPALMERLLARARSMGAPS